MKILVNETPLLAPLRGIGKYVRHLFSATDRLAEAKIRMDICARQTFAACEKIMLAQGCKL